MLCLGKKSAVIAGEAFMPFFLSLGPGKSTYSGGKNNRYIGLICAGVSLY